MSHLSDIEIANQVEMKPIKEVVAQAHKEFKKNEEERSFGVNPKDCPRK